MAEIDITQEWRRLQELYRGMSEEELEAIANQGYELTNIAKQVLHSEILQRHLRVNVRLEPPIVEQVQQLEDDGFDPASLDLVHGFNVESREQAEWVKKTLNDAGIPCYFGPDLVENIERLQFIPEHSVEVKVLKHDLYRIQPVLTSFNEQFPSPEDGEQPDVEVHCPKCRSTEVVFEGFGSNAAKQDEPVDDGNELDEDEQSDEEPEDVEEMRTADPHAKFHWRCDNCGHEWEDEGLES